MASKQNWFDRGADAVDRVWPGNPRCYVCPLCMQGFLPLALDHGVLSLEHAPPKSLGGHKLVLTCRECNSQAGHKLDSQMRLGEDMLDFALGTMPTSVEAQLTLRSGSSVNVGVQHTGESIVVSGSPRQNDPRVMQAWEDELNWLVERGNWDEHQFGLTLRRGYRNKNALVGWLRAAYLIAFAALGYQYIRNQVLDPVRRQLADVGSDFLQSFSVTMPSAAPTERRILIIKEPAVFHSVAVQMGRHLVFLPIATVDGADLYDRLASEQNRNGRFEANISGDEWPWPTGPTLHLDFR